METKKLYLLLDVRTKKDYLAYLTKKELERVLSIGLYELAKPKKPKTEKHKVKNWGFNV